MCVYSHNILLQYPRGKISSSVFTGHGNLPCLVSYFHYITLFYPLLGNFLLFSSPPSLPHTVLAECEGDDESGSSCGDGNIGPDLLPLSMPSSDIKSDLILNMVDTSMCGGGCVTAWRFCYYSARENVKQTLTVPVTFALWRRAGNGTDMVAVVEGSRFSLTITLPVEQWFLCERRVLESRCGVQVGAGDMVGVVIHNDTPLRMVGVSGNGLVAVGGRVQGERGSVTRGSLQERAGHALMLAALVGQCPQCTDRM